VHLAGIPVGQPYNLRLSAAYWKVAAVFESTRPRAVSIGERPRPEPSGEPAICGWTRCTRATGTERKGCAASTQWTR